MARIILLAALVLPGCSFLFVSGPPPNHEQLPHFECSASPAFPIVDTVIAGVMMLAIANIATMTDQQFHDLQCEPGDTTCMPETSRAAPIATFAAIALPYGGAAVYGFTRSKQCRAARGQLAIRAQRPLPPGAWPPTAPAPMPAPTAPAPAPPEPAPTPSAPAPAVAP